MTKCPLPWPQLELKFCLLLQRFWVSSRKSMRERPVLLWFPHKLLHSASLALMFSLKRELAWAQASPMKSILEMAPEFVLLLIFICFLHSVLPRLCFLQVGDTRTVWASSDVLLKIRRPELHPVLNQPELDLLRSGGILVSLAYPHECPELLEIVKQKGATWIALDLVPRSTRAQRLDVLSSQTGRSTRRSFGFIFLLIAGLVFRSCWSSCRVGSGNPSSSSSRRLYFTCGQNASWHGADHWSRSYWSRRCPCCSSARSSGFGSLCMLKSFCLTSFSRFL